MLKPQELTLTRKGENSPSSLVLYGLNSSGKTSFVDGIEWFLSPNNEIEWLKREDARERAYPHQEAQDGDSFVEIDFADDKKEIGVLRKSFNQKKVTQPGLSSETDFEKVYQSFVIRPYLRYLEVIDFVYNRTGLEKYQKLAGWMGFENELSFQEKIALDILPELKRKEKNLTDNVALFERQLVQLMGAGKFADEASILEFCNAIFTKHKVNLSSSIKDIPSRLEELNKLKSAAGVAVKVSKLTEVEVSLTQVSVDDVLINAVDKLNETLTRFLKDKALVQKIDVIDVYTQALDILNRNTDAKTSCPVCGTSWDRGKLQEHIKEELTLLEKIKQEKEEIARTITSTKSLVRREQEMVKQIIWKYEEGQKILPNISYEKLQEYQTALAALDGEFGGNIFEKGRISSSLSLDDIPKINTEKDAALAAIGVEKAKLQLSKDALSLSSDTEKIAQIKDKWKEILEAKSELAFFTAEYSKFAGLGNALVKLIQENIKSRFGEMSAQIGKYFGILRSDKDIKDIEILLNEAKGKAAGRSAEIQLNYYDITVKPAYKVLSESLLNSLGLAVYFACVRQFNEDCKFVVLDDIMNSLDIDNRDTVLDLVEQEFSDYQFILLTHDFYWFQKIMRRFPNWISKKIKGWDYKTGSKIDFAQTSKEEIEELLSDATTVEDAGFKLGRHIEGILNELCENLWAEIRYRYTKNDPPAMEELFDALYKRLKSKVNQNPIVEKVENAKKYEPVLRNFTAHARSNSASTVSPTEVKRAMEEWFILEEDLWCPDCNRYVEYHRSKDAIECKCGKKKLEKVSTKT